VDARSRYADQPHPGRYCDCRSATQPNTTANTKANPKTYAKTNANTADSRTGTTNADA